MNSKFIRKAAVITLSGALLISGGAFIVAEAGFAISEPKAEMKLDQKALVSAVADIKDTNIEETLKIESSSEIKLNDLLSKKVFAVVGEEGYLQVNMSADENSDIAGKVYDTTSFEMLERTEEWTEIQSGNVIGFIKTENVISGKSALAKAKEILAATYPDTDIATLDNDTIEAAFSVAETIEEEQARLVAEEIQRQEEEQARIAAEEAARQAAAQAQGQAIVDYAANFLGNPYVFGGTSLTNGTDCSGYVRGVYAHFGISLPRTSYGMRKVGRAVSASEMMPGDIVCYQGHVGIYAGNGKIVNAIDESKGIGYSNVRLSQVITIRRMY